MFLPNSFWRTRFWKTCGGGIVLGCLSSFSSHSRVLLWYVRLATRANQGCAVPLRYRQNAACLHTRHKVGQTPQLRRIPLANAKGEGPANASPTIQPNMHPRAATSPLTAPNVHAALTLLRSSGRRGVEEEPKWLRGYHIMKYTPC